MIDALDGRYELSLNNAPNQNIKFILSDSDVLGRLGQLRRAHSAGVCKFFVYPHTARPSLINAMYPTWEHTTAQFVATKYHADVLRAYQYAKPIESVGWMLSDVRPFTPRPNFRRVCFAPIHPRNAPVDRAANARAFEMLYQSVRRDEIDLTVRYIGDIGSNGLRHLPSVNYVNVKFDNAAIELNEYDVIVGHQTIAWIAVALGIPCVMFAEDMPTHFRQGVDTYIDVPHWAELSPLFRYPLDLFDHATAMSALSTAILYNEDVSVWRERMIGAPFSADGFVKTLEAYL